MSVTVYEIFANQIKFQKHDLENEGEGQGGEKWDLRRSTGNGRFYISDFFFQNFSYLATYVYALGSIHIKLKHVDLFLFKIYLRFFF